MLNKEFRTIYIKLAMISIIKEVLIYNIIAKDLSFPIHTYLLHTSCFSFFCFSLPLSLSPLPFFLFHFFYIFYIFFGKKKIRMTLCLFQLKTPQALPQVSPIPGTYVSPT